MGKQGDLFDLDASRTARDASLAAVSRLDWQARFLAMVVALPTGWTGIGEDLRRLMQDDRPHHSNAYGAVIRIAITRRIIIKTGRHLPMKSKRSHARSTPEYRRAG